MLLPVTRHTNTFSMVGVSLHASSTFALSGIGLAPRIPSSAVITILHSESLIRPLSASGEKPPNTTE